MSQPNAYNPFSSRREADQNLNAQYGSYNQGYEHNAQRQGNVHVDAPPPSHSRRALSSDANRNLSILLASQNASNHWVFLAWGFIYNVPQLVAIMYILTNYWDQKWGYYYRRSIEAPWSYRETHGVSSCTAPIHMWIVVYGIIRLITLQYSAYRYYAIRRGTPVAEFEYTGIAKQHRLAAVGGSMWFILGMIWTLNESTCQSMTYKPYALAFALMITSWQSMLAPCLLLVALAPFVYFCAPCVIRLLRVFIEPGEHGMGADDNLINNINVGKYIPPEDANNESDHGQLEVEDNHRVIKLTNNSCPICQSDFEANEVLKVLPCSGSHCYHSPCIDEWLRINSICCLCREPVNTRTIQQDRERLQASAPEIAV